MSERNDINEQNRFTARSIEPSKTKNKKRVSLEIDSEDTDFELRRGVLIEKVDGMPDVKNIKNFNLEQMDIDVSINKKKLPIIGDKEPTIQYRIAGTAAAISLATIIGGGFFYSLTNDNINQVVENSNSFSMDIQKVNILFSESVLGKPDSFNELMEVSTKATNSFNNLYGLTGGDNSLKSDLELVNRNILVLKNNFELLRSSTDKVAEFNKEVVDMDAKIDKFISIYSRQALNQNELANVYALKISLQVLNANYSNVLLSDKINETSISLLNQYREAFKDILLTLKDGDRARSINPIQTRELIEAYNLIVPSWTQISNKIQVISSKSKELVDTKNLSDSTYKTILTIVNKTTKMINKYKNDQSHVLLIAQLAMLLGLIILLLSAVTIFYIYSYEQDNKNKEDKYKKEKTEEYINDMTASLLLVQAGDLRNDLNIHEGVTSYIADSINTTIEALRTLVKQSIDMAGVLEEKTNEIQAVSEKMLMNTEKQSKDIKDTGASVIQISEAINKIATKTMSGYEAAKKTVEISRKGNTQVGESLGVMKEIKYNMEETVTLMRKVSASSEQILNIVEILSDINQDTEILSMNATIQATRAGEAGKSFKIVADRMKTFSEKSASESRRVNHLINGVLNDIKAAGIAVEKTRNEVEHGVSVTEKAFESFVDMKDTTEKLAKIVEEISQDAKEHAKTAGEVEAEMRAILTTTEENRQSTLNTVNSIKEISSVAQDMAKSVKTFKIE